MQAVIQRVKSANVKVNNKIVGEIGYGLMVLLGVEKGDSEADARALANKIVNLRIFGDEQDKMNKSLLDINGEMLVVSQFTLIADTSKGRRPSFNNAAKAQLASRLYVLFQKAVLSYGIKVEDGIFQNKMLVSIYNDGPVTLIVDSLNRKGNKALI